MVCKSFKLKADLGQGLPFMKDIMSIRQRSLKVSSAVSTADVGVSVLISS